MPLMVSSSASLSMGLSGLARVRRSSSTWTGVKRRGRAAAIRRAARSARAPGRPRGAPIRPKRRCMCVPASREGEAPRSAVLHACGFNLRLQGLLREKNSHLQDVDGINIRVAHLDQPPQPQVALQQAAVARDVQDGARGVLKALAQLRAQLLLRGVVHLGGMGERRGRGAHNQGARGHERARRREGGLCLWAPRRVVCGRHACVSQRSPACRRRGRRCAYRTWPESWGGGFGQCQQ